MPQEENIQIKKVDRGFRLESKAVVDRPINEVFAFFADASNLDALTPPFLRFEILTPKPIEMRTGTMISYRLRLRGLPIKWRSEITAWEPPHQFVDEQRKGPYRWWVHEHRFVPEGASTSVINDVQFGVLGGSLIAALFVERDLRTIFAYRRQQLHRLFAGSTDLAAPDERKAFDIGASQSC